MKTLQFNISDEACELLKSIKKGGAEYRDTEYLTLQDFKESQVYKDGLRTEQHFLNRNYGGTLYLIEELEHFGLVESDGMSWHITYVLTPFGKEMLETL